MTTSARRKLDEPLSSPLPRRDNLISLGIAVAILAVVVGYAIWVLTTT